MKKVGILVICLIALSLLVVAQSVDNKCYDVCKRECVAGQRSVDECAKVCSVKCTLSSVAIAPSPVRVLTAVAPPPSEPQVNCDNWEALYKRCLSSNDPRACSEKFGVWKQRCQQPPKQPEQPLSCEDNCRRLASQQGLTAATVNVFNQQLFEQCVRDRCNPPPQSCRERCVYQFANIPDKLQECLRSQCGEKPQSCEDVCRRDFGNDQSAFTDCMSKRCLVSELPCEDRCQADNRDCEAGRTFSVDPQTQEGVPCPRVLERCLRLCGRAPRCEDQCVQESKGDDDSYRRCILAQCAPPPDCNEQCRREFAGDDDAMKKCVVDRCAPQNCKRKCIREHVGDDRAVDDCVQRECNQQRPDCKERCRPSYDQCVSSCEQPCANGGCEGKCSQGYASCAARARAAGDSQMLARCRFRLGECLDGCEPSGVLRGSVGSVTPNTVAAPVPPNTVVEQTCDQRCESIGSACRAQGGNDKECRQRVADCLDACHPIHLAPTQGDVPLGQEPKNASPNVLARMWHSFFG